MGVYVFRDWLWGEENRVEGVLFAVELLGCAEAGVVGVLLLLG